MAPGLRRPAGALAGLGLGLCLATAAAAAEGPTPPGTASAPEGAAAIPPLIADADSAAALPAPETVSRHLDLARAARQRGDAFECARRSAFVTVYAESLRAHAVAPGERRRLTAERDEAGKLLRDTAARLSAAEAAAAAAYAGPQADLSLRFARAMLEAGRPGDAAAEALAGLAADPGGPRAKEALALLKGVSAAPRHAGGVHHSVYRAATFLPSSGEYASYGRSLYAGLRLALDEANAADRLAVRLRHYDTGGEAWRAAATAQQALADGAGIFIGDVLSVPTLVLAGASQAHGIPLLSPSATEESVGEAGPAVFQTGLSEAEQGRVLARYAVRELRAQRVAITPETGDLAAGFAEQAVALGAAVVRVATPQGSRDARGAVSELRRAQADALLLPADPGQAEIWIFALARERYTAKLLGSEALDVASLHPDAQREAEGLALVGMDYALPESAFARLDSLVRRTYGFPADRFVRRGYLTGRLLASTLRAGAASPAMVAEALAQRVLVPPDPARPARGFVGYPESEARVPVYLVRRGALVRVR